MPAALILFASAKGEIHRTTGCRDYRLAKIVAAELAAHWHRAIQALARMDITKVRAGSIKLLGDGFITMTEAAEALGATPLALVNQLVTRSAHFFVEAQGWRGWAVDDMYEALHHNHDELGQVEVVIDESSLGGLQAQVKFDGRLRLSWWSRLDWAAVGGFGRKLNCHLVANLVRPWIT